jgi:hypothetical protein
MPQVFISHSSRDRSFVEGEILPLLKRRGIATWYSEADIRTAEQWEKSIRQGLEGSDWFLVVMSSHSADSRWVKREVGWAMEERADRIIPVLIEECDMNRWHLGFRQVQYVDFRQDREAARQRLLAVWDGKGPCCEPSSNGHPEEEADACAPPPVNHGGRSSAAVETETGTTPIEIVINRDFDSYTAKEQEKLLAAIRNLLGISGDIRVISKKRGSVRLTIALTPEQAEKLLWAAKGGQLAELGVVDAILRETEELPPRWPEGYRMMQEIGRGSRGRVFRAIDETLGRVVALREFRGPHGQDAEWRHRFLREVEAVSRLRHPNLVSIYAVMEVLGGYYVAMEYVVGPDLIQHVEKRGPLPVAEALEITRQAALTLDCVHRAGLVHRDIKPANLMLTSTGTLKVLDLGLVCGKTAVECEFARSGGFMGTPDFVAPEQVRDMRMADPRADLYELGGTLFYLLTGAAPFAHCGGSMQEQIAAHLTKKPRDVRSLRPDVPRGLASLVSRLLAKAPEKRPQTAAEVAAELASLVEKPARPHPKKRRWPLWLVLGLTFLAAVLETVAYLNIFPPW